MMQAMVLAFGLGYGLGAVTAMVHLTLEYRRRRGEDADA
jgi:hypothetical protein